MESVRMLSKLGEATNKDKLNGINDKQWSYLSEIAAFQV